MNPYNIYHDIATRTNGDLYVGVVGPVRVGKSTFITKFTEQFILPNISSENMRVRWTSCRKVQTAIRL